MRQIIAVLLVLAGCTACESAASQPPQPPHASSPATPAPSQPTHSKLQVIWTPNLNWKHQPPVTTHGTSAQGRALLHDIRAAKRVRHGAAYSCPIDFGVRARFVYGAQRGSADLGGCRFVQLGHHSYWTDRAIVQDLRALAPHRWLQYLSLRGLK